MIDATVSSPCCCNSYLHFKVVHSIRNISSSFPQLHCSAFALIPLLYMHKIVLHFLLSWKSVSKAINNQPVSFGRDFCAHYHCCLMLILMSVSIQPQNAMLLLSKKPLTFFIFSKLNARKTR